MPACSDGFGVACKRLPARPVLKCCNAFVRTRPARVADKAAAVGMAADAVMAAAVVEVVVHRAPVVTEVAMVLDKAAAVVADAVVNTTLPVHKAHADLKAMVLVAAVKAVVALPWAMHNRAATKADSAAAWASALPAPHQAANLIPCAPVSI